jgi:transposase
MTSYIGIDVGKKSIQLYLAIIDKSFELTNNSEGFSKIINHITKYYKSLSKIIVVFEPTGGYERNLR